MPIFGFIGTCSFEVETAIRLVGNQYAASVICLPELQLVYSFGFQVNCIEVKEEW